jgi:hypothetical protein
VFALIYGVMILNQILGKKSISKKVKFIGFETIASNNQVFQK